MNKIQRVFYIAIVLFVFYVLTILLVFGFNLEEIFFGYQSITLLFPIISPVLAFICVTFWQPRINSKVLDRQKKVDSNLYWIVVSIQLLLFLVPIVMIRHLQGEALLGYLFFSVLYNVLVFVACLLSILGNKKYVLPAKISIAILSLALFTFACWYTTFFNYTP